MYYLTKKRMALFAGLLLALLVMLLVFVLPALKKINSLQERIAIKTKGLDAIETLGREYIRTKEELLTLEGSTIGTNEKAILLSALEKLLVNAGINKELVTISSKHKNILPSISIKDIEMKFEKVSYKELKGLILAIKEYSSTLHLKRLNIKTRFDNPALFNGSIQISVLERE
ncbi:MAG: hypothetical protein ACE5IH_06025 [Thermodesulfobacteriota bacterium]